MEYLVQIALHRFAVRPYGFTHDGSRRARRCEQGLNKPPGLSGVQSDLVALFNNLAGRCHRVQGDKLGHRASLNGGGLTEQLLVRRRYPGNEALAFRFFQCRSHAPNVCLRGTQINNQFASLSSVFINSVECFPLVEKLHGAGNIDPFSRARRVGRTCRSATPDHAGGWAVEKGLLQKVTKETKGKRGPSLCCWDRFFGLRSLRSLLFNFL